MVQRQRTLSVAFVGGFPCELNFTGTLELLQNWE